MAQFAELETGDEESDEHRSYWQVRDRSNGTIALLYRRELAELLDSARSAIPSLLDDSERLAEAEARATRAEAMLRTIADILLAETGTDGPTSPEHAARLAAAEIGVLRRERDTLRGICEELHVDDARDAVEAIYKLKDAIDDASNARVRALAAERDALRAIIAGRETPPTDAEIAAHFAAGGWWRSFRHAYESEHNGRPFTVSAVTREYGSDHFMIVDRMEHTRDGLTTTWWAMRDGRPCAWPVVP